MHNMRSVALAMLGIGLLSACGGGNKTASGDSTKAASSGGVDLTGAGATFPAPIYQKWFSDYAAATGIKINYQSLGSGAGIKQLQEGTVDFGASDAPMSDSEIVRAKGGKVLHFPTVLGADVITYNLPDTTIHLRLTGEAISSIFRGEIKKWNDPRLAALNPGTKLPSQDVLVVHRSEGSGTTYIFTDYLTTVSPAWAKGPGRGKDVQWPVGLGGKGNEGVAGTIKQTPGSVGYVELAYAKQNRLPVALVKNASGKFVEPTIASISAAADGVLSKLGPDTDYRVTVVNAPGDASYPISSMTWLLVYERQPDATKGKKLVDFMRWMYTTGEQSAPTLDYAPLPPPLVERLTARLATIQIGATP